MAFFRYLLYNKEYFSMNNIKNSSFRDIKLSVIRDEYWDFILARDGGSGYLYSSGDDLNTNCLISYIDVDKPNSLINNKLYSLGEYMWPDAVNEGVKLYNIGYVGMDNGLITFQKDRISNEEFFKLFTNSEYDVPEGDKRLYLSKITGNTQIYTYPSEYIQNDKDGNYLKLYGGFYQGFFKLFEEKYQTLPTIIDSDLHLEFVIRKQSYKEDINTLNSTHPENKGIFFYIGTRTENKFYQFYNNDGKGVIDRGCMDYLGDGYLSENILSNEKKPVLGDYFYGTEPEPDTYIRRSDIEYDYINFGVCPPIQPPRPISDCNPIIDDYVIWEKPFYCLDDYVCKDCNTQICDTGTTCEEPPVTGPFTHPPITGEYWFNVYGYATSNACPPNCGQNNCTNITKPNCKTVNQCFYEWPEPKPCPPVKPNCCKEGIPEGVIYEDCDCGDKPVFSTESPDCGCSIDTIIDNDYFKDDYFDYCGNSCKPIILPCEDDSKYLLEDEYFMAEMSLTDVILAPTVDGFEVSKHGYYEIKSDNKYLLFNRTDTGYTTDNWIDGLEHVFRGVKNRPKDNYFLLFNRTPTGYTTDTIDQYLEENGNEYDILKDLYENAFALIVNDDGGVGYRYLIKDCDSDEDYTIKTEQSKPNMVKEGEWTTINVRFVILNGGLNECNKPLGKRKMKVYIYVNGYLKFISQELPELNLRQLDDVADKQESVPYNISLGGGTQGLADEVWLEYMKKPDKILPLEKNFAGTFIGDIKSFKIYNCFQEYRTIKNNLKYVKNN
jgi:hypothetical protein